MKLNDTISVSRGQIKPDLVLKNVQLINVHSHEIYKTDIAIHEELIVGLGNYTGIKEINLQGYHVCPGLVDGHLHVESSMMTIPEFTRAVLPRGTTSLIIDPHEISNVMGLEGINYMLKSSKYNPMNVYLMLPSCVPSTRMETAGADLKAIDLLPLLNNKWVLGMGELMNYPGLLSQDEDVLEKLKICEDRIIDGHAPQLTGKDLCAYVSMGIKSDHECTTVAEAQEKLRLGMHIMLREGSSSKNLLDLLPLVTLDNVNRFFFVTDDRNPLDLMQEGHIDHIIRLAIDHGLDPILAIRMATLNPAQYFNIRKIGAIAPGNLADLVVFKDFKDFHAKMVFKNGKQVAEDGKPTFPPLDARPSKLRGSVNIKWLSTDDFVIKAEGRQCRVIGLVPNQIITKSLILEPPVADGLVIADPERDIVKIAVIERHMASDKVSLGLLQGYGLREGAIGTTVAHDSHNMVVAGTNDQDMFLAAVQLARMQGGIAIAHNGKIVESLPLPIAGLMSDQPLEFVVERLSSLIRYAHTLGITASDPFMALSFLALPVIPHLKITDKGLIDVDKFSPVPFFLE